MSDFFCLSDAQMARLEPFFPKTHGKPRVDDRRVLSGIIFINRNGLRWRDAPAVYIKRGTPQLNGKVERSHRSDQQEFDQLLSYKGDVDVEAKVDEWERFYNFARPHGAHNGQTPYEALRDKLQ